MSDNIETKSMTFISFSIQSRVLVLRFLEINNRHYLFIPTNDDIQRYCF